MIVYRTIKRYNETGNVLDKQRSGRPRSIRTPGLKNSVRCRIFRNPRRSMRKMAREFKVNYETMCKLVSEDLGMRSFKRSKVHHLNDSIRAKRLTRCKGLLKRFGTGDIDRMLFTDEKIFTVAEATNKQNDRILSKNTQSIPESAKVVDRTHHPLSVMVWAGVSAESRTNLIFVPKGVKINAKNYIDTILQTEVSGGGESLFKNEDWTFQQYSAPAYSAKITQSWFRDRNINFISKDEWPPSSPVLNPMDYAVWSILETRACAKPHKNIEALKSNLKREWQKIPQEQLRQSVHRFRDKVRAVVSKKGGYIE